MKYLIEIDKAIHILFINITIQNPFFDSLMPFVTKLEIKTYQLLQDLSVFLYTGKKKERLFLILLIATILLVDYIATQFIKYIFIRIRPCNALS